MVQQATSLARMLTSHIGLSIESQNIFLVIQLPANATRKATTDDTNTWSRPSLWETRIDFSGSWLQPVTTAIWEVD